MSGEGATTPRRTADASALVCTVVASEDSLLLWRMLELLAFVLAGWPMTTPPPLLVRGGCACWPPVPGSVAPDIAIAAASAAAWAAEAAA